MDHTVFREQITPVDEEIHEEQLPVGKEPVLTTRDTSDIEVPYTDYKKAHNHPHAVDYFKLGDHWDEPEGGYSKEVSVIEDYLLHKIDNGDIDNSITAIKRELESIESLHNLKEETRVPIKIGTIVAYIKFLQETHHIKTSFKRRVRQYGYTK